MLKPLFYKRDASLNLFQAEWLHVDQARWAAVGGCDTARLSGTSGGRLDLAQAVGLLRCGVELVDENGDPCWWGYVARIELWAGLVGAVCDLDELSNRVKVSYTRLDFHAAAGGVKDATAWAEELNSQAIYGVKEKIVRLQGTTLAQAEAARNVELSGHGWPAARPVVNRSGAAGPGPDVVIVLRGWWHSMAWRSYNQTAGIIEHVVEKPGYQNSSAWPPENKFAQAFTVGTVGWQAAAVWVRLTKIGAPSDNVRCAIYSNNGTVPGTSLVSLTKPASEITQSSYSWTQFVFPSPITMEDNNYWLVFDRTGSVSGINYYRYLVDVTASYLGGGFKYWNSTASQWVDPALTRQRDLLFRVVGGMETTRQIGYMAAAGGQFMSGGVSMEVNSGLYTSPFRNGERTALDEIAVQLKAGDVTSNRLLAEVTRTRQLRIYAAPSKGGAKNHIDATGHLVDRFGSPLSPGAAAAGHWAVLDSPWLGAGGEGLHISDRIFLEAVEYDPDFGRLQPGNF